MKSTFSWFWHNTDINDEKIKIDIIKFKIKFSDTEIYTKE